MANQTCCGGASSGQKRKKGGGCCGADSVKAVIDPSAVEDMGGADACCGKAEQAAEPSAQAECGCEGSKSIQEKWVTGILKTDAGDIPQVSTRLAFADVLGSWKCRWSIGRMDYTVEPGLYGVGSPGKQSPVLVTANYKMTFDSLRRELGGIDAWILVLDTDGVNVWCAAGKGTFGTEELVSRISGAKLARVVTHRTIIVPQLGATGVAAHEVARQSGFHVVYGPVRACDIKAYLAAGEKATEDMRTVKFTLWDRLVLTPMELVGALKPSMFVFGALFLLNAVGLGHYGLVDLVAYAGAVFAGCVVAPVLLPWIPGRAFAFKGFLVGLLWAAGLLFMNGFPPMPEFGWLKAAAYMLILPAIAAFCTMNFTGSSTYTSLSGVDKEMKIALPAMLISTGIGVILLLINDLIKVFA